MTNLTFNDYQQATANTAFYPEAGTGSLMAILYVALGLGEAGEIQGKIKKVLRDANGIITSDARKAILKEVGDLQWYVARMAMELNADLSDVATANLDKLDDRKLRGVIGGDGDDR